MTYKEMSLTELINEIERVEYLLGWNKHPHTQKQNKKYLSRLKDEYYKRIHR